MNKTLFIAFSIAFSSVAAANEAAVPVPAPEVEITFQSIDTNADGVISLTEVSDKEDLLLAFAELDLDKNGDLTEIEYNKFRELK